MANILDYIANIEPDIAEIHSECVCVVDISCEGFMAVGNSAYCELPHPMVYGTCRQENFVYCELPALECRAGTEPYISAVCEFPALECSGVLRPSAAATVFIPLPYAVGSMRASGGYGYCEIPLLECHAIDDSFRTTITGHCELPPLECYAIDDSFRTTGTVYCEIPALECSATSCGIASPADAYDFQITRMILNGDQTMFLLASDITSSPDNDSKVQDIFNWVGQNINYSTDPTTHGEADYWSCPLETIGVGSGDCEDGTFLLHSLCNAIGVPVERMWTVIDYPAEHAYCVYQREQDGQWILLDWTAYSGPVLLPDVRTLAGAGSGNHCSLAINHMEVRRPDTDIRNFFISVSAYLEIGIECHGTMQHGWNGVCEIPAPECHAYSGSIALCEFRPLECTGKLRESGGVAVCEIPAPECQAYSGATALCEFQPLECHGRMLTGTVASCECVLPIMQCSGVLRVENVGSCTCVLPSLTCHATGTIGTVSTVYCEIVIACSGHMTHGATGTGYCEIPALECSATCFHNPRGEVHLEIPLPQCIGYMRSASAEQILRYRRP